MERALGHRTDIQEALDLPLPDLSAHVWGWYHQLTGKRTYGPSLPDPITWQELAAWSQMTGIVPERWELDAITGIDNAWRASIAT